MRGLDTDPLKDSFLAMKSVYMRLISETTVSTMVWQCTGLV